MKKLLLLTSIFTGFSGRSFASNAQLELIDSSTDSSVIMVTPGNTFTLAVELLGPTTPVELDSFDLTLSGSTDSSTPLPTGIAVTSFSNLASGFEGGEGESNPDVFIASADSTADDLSLSSGTSVDMVDVTFTVSSDLTAGSYAIDFAPTGDLQNLYDAELNAIPYDALGATLDVLEVGEPKIGSLFSTGFLMIMGFWFLRCVCSVESLVVPKRVHY